MVLGEKKTISEVSNKPLLKNQILDRPGYFVRHFFLTRDLRVARPVAAASFLPAAAHTQLAAASSQQAGR
jgi:hypothetical protein